MNHLEDNIIADWFSSELILYFCTNKRQQVRNKGARTISACLSSVWVHLLAARLSFKVKAQFKWEVCCWLTERLKWWYQWYKLTNNGGKKKDSLMNKKLKYTHSHVLLYSLRGDSVGWWPGHGAPRRSLNVQFWGPRCSPLFQKRKSLHRAPSPPLLRLSAGEQGSH